MLKILIKKPHLPQGGFLLLPFSDDMILEQNDFFFIIQSIYIHSFSFNLSEMQEMYSSLQAQVRMGCVYDSFFVKFSTVSTADEVSFPSLSAPLK